MDFFLSKSEKVITDFFINDSSLFIDLISEYYPLDKSLIDKYQDSLDWQKLSINENIIWTNDSSLYRLALTETRHGLFLCDFKWSNGRN